MAMEVASPLVGSLAVTARAMAALLVVWALMVVLVDS